METKDLNEKNIEKIAALFPNVITEMKDENGKLKKGINFELLKQELSEDVIDGEECYDFTWVGKKAAIVESNTPIRKTLRPCLEESKDWENTENLYIEGDNLEVLKLLQESYLNSIKMIYIDPPYNTGNDFIYKDDFKINKDDYEEQIGLYDEEDKNMMFKNTDSNGRFHSDWCSMMYPRLKLAQNLLSEDGVIFISIDDNEVENLKKICNEIFGESNFRNVISVRRYDKNINRQFMEQGLSTMNIGLEYILMYSKGSGTKFCPVFKEASEERTTKGYWKGFWNDADRPTMRYEILGVTPESGQWKWKYEVAKEALDNYIEYEKHYINDFTLEDYWEKTGKVKKFIRRNMNGKGKNSGVEHWVAPADGILRNSNWSDILASRPAGFDIPFESPKNYELIILLNKLAGTEVNDTILDFFSGSSTTAHAVMELNAEDGGDRKFIMVQLPEKIDEKSEAYKAGYKNICEIGKERIRRAGEKIKLEIEKGNIKLKEEEEPKKVPDIGFRVFKVDSTNMKDVYYSANDYKQEMIEGLASNIKEDRSDLDLLYGVMLDWNLQLSLKHEIRKIEDTTIHLVDNTSLIACFENKVSESVIREIANLKPLRVVFRDSCFDGSPEKINVEEIFKLLSPNTSVRVI